MTQVLAGKIALITGGSRGIGAATALELAAQGATVAFSYSASEDKANEVVAKIEAAGGSAVAFKADQTVESDVVGLIAAVVERFGKLDILVNNAGVFEAGTIQDTLDTARFERQVAINYQAVVVAIREASRVMGEGGRIITLSSGLAARSSWPGIADYSATKRAIEGYSKGASRDLGPKGITVNVIGTGSIDTDMNPSNGPLSEYQKAATALGRYGRPEEIAAAIAFIASPAASYITGAIVPVDGGYSA
ncbi:SDR family NAD(P)-dependent oxidoreductase [Sphingobium xenophagum]|uniref:SDR family NAD(P)-dependent oxidoreductase n=1 Tax=Sphingobium xenophagum TaxID=121428 RepID=UPI000362290B|nr:SDR family oxidoreductase [Sphingobium xenophagum]